ncbi:hypothetical protein JW949_03765 [Candidatus Woesearchaeota archaeon]|nr:hypothetical protein [Candidatus Woesearchaeota archaeon]
MMNEEYESGLVRILKENGATEEDCKGVDNIWREKYGRPKKNAIFTYHDRLILGIVGFIKKPKKIPWEIYKEFSLYIPEDADLDNVTILSKMGYELLEFDFHQMGFFATRKFFRELKYLRSKMLL